MRKSDIFLSFIAVNALLLCLAFAHAHHRERADAPMLARVARTVGDLRLTDLCLCTEARYTRHLSQADWHASFQDHPFALEHFPAGSIMRPPDILKRTYERLD